MTPPDPTTQTLLSREDVISGLKYIAESPAQEHGGFHPNAIAIAKGALAVLLAAEAENGALKAHLAKYDFLAVTHPHLYQGKP